MNYYKSTINYLLALFLCFAAFRCYPQAQILKDFAIHKNQQWQTRKAYADSLAEKKRVQKRWIDQNIAVTELQRFEHGIPIYFQTENKNAASTISANLTWVESGFIPGLSGVNTISGIWDGGYVLKNHQEFFSTNTSRVIQHDKPTYLGVHATHLSGTMIAKGENSLSRGMASAGLIYAYDFNNDIAEMASEAADGLLVSNHSYGPLCGWSYNSSDGMWYWHGDLDISKIEDLKFGLYTQTSHDLDFISYYAPEYLIVKSVGNDRNDAPESQPVEHYVWNDNWKLSTTVHDPDGGTDGFDCLSPMAVAKNILTVGAVDDLPSGYSTANEVHLAPFSSFGPTDDGRIKPDLVANGMSILSCGAEDDSYLELSGTSMSAASITGSILLLHELQQQLQPGVTLSSATIKGLLVHTADECGSNPGPDYQFGWGLANIHKASKLLKDNFSNGGENIVETKLSQSEELSFPIKIPENTNQLRTTICWTDPPGDISPYILNNTAANLINNLDIKLVQVSTGQNYYPWTLNPTTPSNAATRGINNVDNIEQILLDAPTPGEYVINITHQGILQNNQQAFTLIVTGIATEDQLLPPENLTYYTGNNEVYLNWEMGESESCEHYNVYRNGNILGSTSNLFYDDLAVQYGTKYTYFITAAYPDGKESISTNEVQVKPILPKSMPYTMNCESDLEDWSVKAELSGWRLGDSDSLNCYYLNFSSNSGHFFGIDSYSAGDGVHVSDIAISPPINLDYYEDIKLSFDYMLITGIYETTNEIDVLYRLNEASDWIEIVNLAVAALDWKHFQIALPPEVAVTGFQLGFRYDDHYLRGMGAGLDNIQLSGTLNITDDISLESISSPISPQCMDEDPKDLSLIIKNTGNTVIQNGESLSISILYDNKEKSFTHSIVGNLSVGESRIITYSESIDPLPVGTLSLKATVYWSKDQNSENNTQIKEVTVNSLPEINFITPLEHLCKDSEPVTIEVIPSGGTYDNEFMIDNQFNPSLAVIGTHEIIYTYTDDNNCSNSASTNIEVLPIPVVSFTGLIDKYCINGSSSILTGVPAGGDFIGPGMDDTCFYPTLAGIGMAEVIYFFTDQNGCSSSAIQSTMIYDSTRVEIVNISDGYCQESDPVVLSATPDGGTFLINGVEGDQFFPSQMETGIVDILYSYMDENKCISTVTTSTKIIATPDPFIVGLDELYCLIDTNYYLVGIPEGGAFYLGEEVISKFNPIDLGTGSFEILYEYINDEGCIGRTNQTFKISANPQISILGLNNTYCPNSEQVVLEGNPTGGIFVGEGITENVFYPAMLQTGTYQISYIYDFNGCEISVAEQTIITEPSAVSINGLVPRYCPADSLQGVIGLPQGGIFHVEPANQQVEGTKTYDLYYTYVDLNSCSFTDRGKFEIFEKPEFIPPEDLELSSGEIITLDLNNSTCSYVWPNDSVSKKINIIGENYELGENTLPVLILDSNGCSSAYEINFLISGITAIPKNQNILDIKIYPNPAENFIIIELPDEDLPKSLTITLLDIRGEVIKYWGKRKFIPSKIQIDLSQQNPGVYLLIIENMEIYEVQKISVVK